MVREVWAHGDAYEGFVGRWSRRVAPGFVAWLGVPAGARWLDVGCGTGALAATILAAADPASILGIDSSDGFLEQARAAIADARATFRLGDAQSLPVEDATVDAVVSALTLNFVLDPGQAVAEFARVARPGGTVAAYVWDYAEGMEILRLFWWAAADLDPAAAELDEGYRFPICHPEPLTALWTRAGLVSPATTAIDVETAFRNFDDYWTPFLGGQGPAPAYVATLSDGHRIALRERLRERAPAGLRLTARAWAVVGTKA